MVVDCIYLVCPFHQNFITMTTKEATMTTQEIADRFYEMTQQGKWNEIQQEFFAEPEHSQGLKTVKGLDAIKKKGESFNQMVEEMHGGYCSKPVVGGNYFSVAMGMDVTMKGAGRTKMDEIAVYGVKDGKIISEQFFY